MAEGRVVRMALLAAGCAGEVGVVTGMAARSACDPAGRGRTVTGTTIKIGRSGQLQDKPPCRGLGLKVAADIGTCGIDKIWD